MPRPKPVEIALDFVDQILDARDGQSLTALLRAALHPLGCRWFLIAPVPEPVAGKGLTPRLLDWPPGWHSRYVEAGYYGVDPIARHARRTTTPFLWSEARWDRDHDPAASQMMADAKTYGMSDGIVFPIIAANGNQEVVSFAQRGGRLRDDACNALQLIAIYAHHRACGLGLTPASRPVRGALH